MRGSANYNERLPLIRSVPNLGPGGTQPAWARNGRQLFYAAPDPNATTGKMMAVDVALTPTFNAA
jgi:hypothetical protein